MHVRMLTLAVALVTALALPAAPAGADPNPPVESFDYTENMEPLGWAPRPNPASGIYNSDLAFWGDLAFQGTYDGFHVVDISTPEDPQTINDYNGCSGTTSSNQGDVLIWDNLLIRAWNSPSGSGNLCDGEPVPSGFEGIHIFDVSDPTDPDLVGAVPTCNGAHTETLVPDLENDRIIVYSNASSSGGGCGGFDVVEIPLDDPGAASVLRHETPEPNRSCHDTAVILGEAMLVACAGGNGWAAWSIGGERGGSIEDPLQVHNQTVSGVSIGHAASFSYDGSIFVFGHEPGGGSGARCQATSATVDKTVFFYETETFTEVGRWVLPRPQTSAENCTVHNFNVVPTDRANILVSGSYQSGIGIVDFTDPSAPYEIAYADPAPLSPTQLGGDWSTYWYNGTIYESDITRGLLTWRLHDLRVLGAQELTHANPQTQEHTIDPFPGDLSVSLVSSATGLVVGESMTYTATVTNGGPNAADAVELTDTLPGMLAFGGAEASQGSCEHDGAGVGGTLTCALGALGVGESATVTIDVTAEGAGFVRNTASALGSVFDADRANNEATATVSVNPFATVLDPEATVDGDSATVSGSATFPTIGTQDVGGTLTPHNANLQDAAEAAGVDLTGATITPIDGGLRFAWKLSDLPANTGAPAEVARYAWTLQTAGGTVYQLEAKRTNAVSVNAVEDPVGHAQHAAAEGGVFRLRGNCGDYAGAPVPECEHLAWLTGQFDAANDRVTIDWPFLTKNAADVVVAPDFTPGATLSPATFTGMSISASLQAGATVNATTSAYLNGWSVYYVGPRVQLGVGPAGIDPSTVSYGPAVSSGAGPFSGSVSGIGGDDDTVYARACTGLLCGFAGLTVA